MVAAIGLQVALLLAALLWPGLLLFLTLVSDWRAFAPGTGPHGWERLLFPTTGNAEPPDNRDFSEQ